MRGPIVFLLASVSSKVHRDIRYMESYRYMAAMAGKLGYDVRFVLGIEHYNNGLFTSYWKFKSDKLIKIEMPFKAYVVYVRERIKNIHFERKVNDTYIEEVCRDKMRTYELFPNLVKKTITLSSTNLSTIKELKTNLVVLKPRYGANGRRVQVIAKEAITSAILADDEFIAQEFIDSSGGIEGLISTRHELRVYLFNGTIHAAYIRVPAQGSYIANISRGAKEQQIKLTDVPQSALDLASNVDSTFTGAFPRLYTIDIMYEEGKPWIVELNDNPGMPDIHVQPFTDDYLHTLLNFLDQS